MKVAIVGFGRAGRFHLAAAQGAKDMNVVAACDPVVEGRQAASENGLRSYASLGELLLREDIEAAIICTPTKEHVPAALSCVGQGVHVLCEKPLAMSSRQASSMIDAANHHTTLLLASKFRHVPEIRRAKQMLEAGDLGEMRTFHISFRSVVDMTGRWNSDVERSGGGVIADNGSHVFDLASYLFGPLARIKAVAQQPGQLLRVEDAAWLEIETCQGVVGNAELSWSTPPSSDIYLTIEGTRATIAIGWKGCSIKPSGGEWQSFGNAYDRDTAHRSMQASFCRVVASQAAPWISREECIQTVQAVEASYRSLQTGASELIAVASLPPVAPPFSEAANEPAAS